MKKTKERIIKKTEEFKQRLKKSKKEVLYPKMLNKQAVICELYRKFRNLEIDASVNAKIIVHYEESIKTYSPDLIVFDKRKPIFVICATSGDGINIYDKNNIVSASVGEQFLICNGFKDIENTIDYVKNYFRK